MPRICESSEQAERCAGILKALGHPVRLRIVALLCEDEAHVNQLAEQLEVRQSVVSQQLRILRMSDLVGVTRRDGYSVYWLAKPGLRSLVKCVQQCGSN